MSLSSNSARSSRLPEWLKVRLPRDGCFGHSRTLLSDLSLNTVCQSARCPNVFECFSKRTATFLIMGRVCTRDCAFCNISPGSPEPLDPGEPARVAEAAARLGLRHVVITSVTRDDLPDGGASHFAAVIRAVRQSAQSDDGPPASPAGADEQGAASPRPLRPLRVEALIPDFQGSAAALAEVLDAGLDVLNHNVETAAALHPRIRPQADYVRSLELLARAKADGRVLTKSGFMLGLGESLDQAKMVIRDLRGVGCDIVTIGQYLRPSARHPEPARYAHPDEFAELSAYGRELGVPNMFCGPLVRSSYHAEEVAETVAPRP